MTDKVPESQSDPELPMVVYLRGDEDLVEDFRLDAEEAMDMLGIKRSRLTQISGRELRVGRIRRDRYIRPVYRLKDLEDYQAWTRSTASHQSSSLLIEKVIDRVERQCRQLEDAAIGPYRKNLEEAVSQLKRELKIMAGRFETELKQQQRWQQQKWSQQPDLWFRLLVPFESVERGIAAIKSLVHKDFGHVQEVQSALYKDLQELISLHRRLIAKLEENSQKQLDVFEQKLIEQKESILGLVEKQRQLVDKGMADMEERILAQLAANQSPSPSRVKRALPLGQRRKQQVFAGRRA